MSPRIDDKEELKKYRIGFLLRAIYFFGILFITFVLDDFVDSNFAEGIVIGSLKISKLWIILISYLTILIILNLIIVKLPWYPKIREYLIFYTDKESIKNVFSKEEFK